MSETRSAEANRKMWAMLRDLSRQVPWVVNGRTVKMGEDDWKCVITAGLRKEQRIAAGMDGGWVMLGQRTSKMTVREMSDLIEIMTAFGAERGVVWTDPAKDYSSYPEARAA